MTLITAYPAATAFADADLFFLSQAGVAKKATPLLLSAYIVDLIEAQTDPGSTSTADSVYILQGGVMRKLAIDTLLAYVLDTAWGRTPEGTPDVADLMLLKDGPTEKTVTIALLAELIRATIEPAILDVSNLSDGGGALQASDHILVTQGSDGKRATVAELSTLLYSTFAAHVIALTGTVTAGGTDLFYFLQGGTVEKKMTLAELATYVAAQATLSGTGTTDFIPKWTSSTVLAAGYSVLASGGDMGAGTDAQVATTKAIREELDDLITDGIVDEIYVRASDMYRPDTLFAGALGRTEFGTTTVTIEYVPFADGSEQRALFVVRMPPSWDRQTVRAKFDWTGDAASSQDDDVEWALQGLALGDDDVMDTAFGTAVVITDAALAGGGAKWQRTDATPAMTIAGSPALDDLVVFQVTRNTDGTDDMVEDALLIGVLIQFTKNAPVAAWA